MANEENVRKWVAALKSGEYTQGFGALEYVVNGTRKNCCLGVATRVFMGENPDALEPSVSDELVNHTNEENSAYKIEFKYQSDDEDYPEASEPDNLPSPVMEWLGIDYSDPDFDLYDPDARETASAVDLNDGDNYTFIQIANVIEKNYLSGDSGS